MEVAKGMSEIGIAVSAMAVLALAINKMARTVWNVMARFGFVEPIQDNHELIGILKAVKEFGDAMVTCGQDLARLIEWLSRD